MKRIILSLLILLVILFMGTSGYMIIEGSSFTDSLYMSVITITTVGYGEIIKLSTIGKYFTMGLILVGVGFVLFLVSEITEAMVEGGLQRIFGRGNMEKKLAGLSNHYLVCGFGRIGKVICKNFTENKFPFVVIENDPVELQKIEELGYLGIEGDATDDDLLERAGIKRAKGLIAVVSSDAQNVYIILSARGLNPSLFILARSSGAERSETKLLRAGANKVISPYYIGACRMAQLVVRPTVVDFLDLTVGGELGLRLEELRVTEKSSFAGQNLLESKIRGDYDVIVVAIKREHGEMYFNPNPKTIMNAGDVLIVLGEHDHISELEKNL